MILRRLALLVLLSFACDGSPAFAVPPPAGSVQAVKVITCDGVDSGTTNLTTVTVTGFPSYATQAWVDSVGDWFVLGPAEATAQPEVVVPASDGRQWVRQFIPNPKWQKQNTWSVDESNATGLASDENTCADDTHPCLTIDEFVRRMGHVVLTQAVAVRWLSDTTHYSIDLSAITGSNQAALAPTTNYPLVIVGVPTVIRTGILTGATNAPWTVSDSSLPVSWSASGCLSTSSGVRVIRKTDGSKHAMMGYENSVKTAQVSPTNGYSETWSVAGTASASFTPGDAYEVLSVPKFPRVFASVSVPNFIGSYFTCLKIAILVSSK